MNKYDPYANPGTFLSITKAAMPFLMVATLGLLGSGLYASLWQSPADYEQGEFVRIMYVHVPSAWLGLGCYAFMAVLSGFYLVAKYPLADMMARAVAPVGAGFTFICLVTGMLWGKPMWGTYWIWDARLTSMLLLLFLYVGYMALSQAFDDEKKGAVPSAVLAILGAVNLPIIKFSVDWWNTLHQPSSIFRSQGSAVHPEMLTPLMLMALGGACFMVLVMMLNLQTMVMEKKLRRRRRFTSSGVSTSA